tara:strand:- start:2462 stop:2731 length:270 start_codon:yes stop_codon:yes gene_type:complete
MSRLRRPNPNRKQLLFFTQDQLKENYFAVVRITWFAAGQICAITESVVYQSDLEAVAEFSGIIGEALRGGADVSVVCIASSKDVGLEPA